MGLQERHLVPEVMDQPGLDRERHRNALRGLERINTWSRSGAILWPLIERCSSRSGELRLLDLATGAGDVPLWLARRAQAKNIPLRVEACDVSPVAIEYAQEKAKRHSTPVTFYEHDVVADGIPEGYDIITSSLFLHHLEADEAVTFLSRMKDAAGKLALVNDLRRSWPGLLLAYLGTRMLSRSSIVHQDGPQSVRAAFTLAEMRALAERAGMTDARVESRWPCRMLLSWEKP